MTLGIVAASGDRLADVLAVLDQPGEPSECWCQFHRCADQATWTTRTPDRNRADLERLVASGRTPGLLAAEDGRPVGWCAVAPVAELDRISSSPFVAGLRSPDEELTDRWSVTCFVVAPAARGRGVSRSLLHAAVEHARTEGASAVEAYPVDLSTSPPEADDRLFAGTLTTFLAAGFQEVARLGPHNAIVVRRI